MAVGALSASDLSDMCRPLVGTSKEVSNNHGPHGQHGHHGRRRRRSSRSRRRSSRNRRRHGLRALDEEVESTRKLLSAEESCLERIQTCATAGIGMKWTGTGCTKRKGRK